MEDVEFTRSHSNSPLPEAGHDPGDPLRPEIDEENSTPNPPITDPQLDMEVQEDDEKGILPDQQDIEEAGLSDNESALSEVDEAQFEDFDIGDIAVQERPAQIIDDTNLNLIGVHKRKRAEGEGEAPKKKKKRADKPRRKKAKDNEGAAGDETGARKTRKSRREGRVRGASPDEVAEEQLSPEEIRKRALDRAMDEAVRTTTRRRKMAGVDLEGMADEEIAQMYTEMVKAAQADNQGRERGEPARHKLQLLPRVMTLLNKQNLRENIVDPDTNLLQAIKFFLEPLNDGSLPAYDIQKELFGALAKLPINKDSLIASGIGKVIIFYIKSKRPEPAIKRQAERLFTDWTRPILRRSDDYRKKQFKTVDYDPTKSSVTRNTRPADSQAAAARAKALEAPRAYQRARMEGGPTTYTVVPKSNFIANNETGRRSYAGGEDILKRMKARTGRGGR
ncbi:uncharacterized protein EI97DRAFT_435371 [Westerdykella ornata]|uniref:TFIIS N-terminal domain-containing protein n=1 Tax=Westerdykella ornata TaxID=318751 RepID=A0A6A6JDE0_WESOR|nr:uncharacterized protein EI97DRAFT_435371 [Westerdykella ornata]KAF2274285.1 hypothetical protein EI97DRAFT_435371 [Westerdykella ornata]